MTSKMRDMDSDLFVDNDLDKYSFYMRNILDFSYGIDEDRRKELARYLEHPSCITKELYLAGVAANDVFGRLLAHSFTANFTVSVLDLSNNRLTEDSAPVIATMLRANITLRRLSLSRNLFGPKGSAEIVSAMAVNRGIHTLDLSDIGMASEAGRALADVLRNNRVLQQLDVSKNSMGEEAVEIAKALPQNSTLTLLNLSDNSFSRAGDDLLESLRYNGTLMWLDVSGNKIHEQMIYAISDALQSRRDANSVSAPLPGIRAPTPRTLASQRSGTASLAQSLFSGHPPHSARRGVDDTVSQPGYQESIIYSNPHSYFPNTPAAAGARSSGSAPLSPVVPRLTLDVQQSDATAAAMLPSTKPSRISGRRGTPTPKTPTMERINGPITATSLSRAPSAVVGTRTVVTNPSVATLSPRQPTPIASAPTQQSAPPTQIFSSTPSQQPHVSMRAQPTPRAPASPLSVPTAAIVRPPLASTSVPVAGSASIPTLVASSTDSVQFSSAPACATASVDVSDPTALSALLMAMERRIKRMEEHESAQAQTVRDLQQQVDQQQLVMQQQQRVISNLESLVAESGSTIGMLNAKTRETEATVQDQQEMLMQQSDDLEILQHSASAFEGQGQAQGNAINVLIEEVGRLRMRLGAGKPTRPSISKKKPLA
eukprot:TRINITY_DN4690_c0_g1_i1.p1 TRINITY_DN4690_c0_g1~~TRINITY_DN4690_c0_g1_i1.p1  ORF type:complete len:656 (-),score=134.82 TRINITY_DN4690_c0_g1_i1:57-2024(-)